VRHRPVLPAGWALGLVLAAAPVAAGAAPLPPVRLDQGWRFAFGSHEGAGQAGYRDDDWQSVTLPHTWNAEDAFTRVPSFREGAGWYRRWVAIPAAWRGRRLVLRFGAANQVTDVWWNGRLVTHHAGGYTAFACDLGEPRLDAPNLLAVRVDNTVGTVPPLIADYDFYGGIYRDVWLIPLAPIHFARLDHAAPGAWAEATQVSDASATIAIRGRISNTGARTTRVAVEARVLDPEGRPVCTPHMALTLPAGGDTAFTLPAGTIPHPRLWSPASPNLYHVEVTLAVQDRVIDRIRTPLGLRWFAVDADHGLTLNGSPLRLNGTNRHQDHAGLGNAVPDTLQVADIERIRADGFNFVRLAHYPQSDAVLDACDRLGLVVWEEIPVVNRVDTTAVFETHARTMLVEMIRQHRAHPSILFWGLANEVLLLKPAPLPSGYVARTATLVRDLRDLARAEDPGRLTALAISFDELDDDSGIQDLTDVLGLNLYFGWYYRKLEDLGPWLDAFHAAHPGRPIVISEYGADSDERVHSPDPKAMDFSIEYQQRFHESTFPELEKRDWLVGTALWNQFDFGSRRRDDTKPNLNKKGLYFFDRRPKDVAFYYRARLSREPVLHVAARDWPRRAGSQAGEQNNVLVYSNLPKVELRLDDRSLGVRSITNGAARWPVAFDAGAHVLEARGEYRGRMITDTCPVTFEDRSGACSDPAPPRFTLAMNASSCQVLGADGTIWESCRDYTPGGWGRLGGRTATTRHRMFDTEDDALFQSTLEGIEVLQFDVPEGTYEVELCLAETANHEPGQRVFNVTVNGEPLVTGLDLAQLAGPFHAVRRTVRVVCRGRTGLRVDFHALHGEATVSAVRVVRD
jgi:beta-galactosidase